MIAILVFIVFGMFFLKGKLAWNYVVAFAFLGDAAFFAFAFKSPVPVMRKFSGPRGCLQLGLLKFVAVNC